MKVKYIDEIIEPKNDFFQIDNVIFNVKDLKDLNYNYDSGSNKRRLYFY